MLGQGRHAAVGQHAVGRPHPSGHGSGLKASFLAYVLHSSKLTWKWRGAPFEITIIFIEPSMGFHVNLGEGI